MKLLAALAPLAAILAIPHCASDPIPPQDHVRTLIEYDQNINVMRMDWTSDNVLLLEVQELPSRETSLLAVDRDGNLTTVLDAPAILTCDRGLNKGVGRQGPFEDWTYYLLDVEGNTVRKTIFNVGLDGVETRWAACRPPRQRPPIGGDNPSSRRTVREFRDWDYPHAARVYVDEELERQNVFFLDRDGQPIPVPFSEHNLKWAWTNPSRYDLSVVNNGEDLFLSPQFGGRAREGFTETGLPFEMAMLSADGTVSIIPVIFDENSPPMSWTFLYTARGPMSYADFSYIRSRKNSEAGMWVYGPDGFERVFQGSVFRAEVNPVNACEVAMILPKGNRYRLDGPQSTELAILNICAAMD